MIRVVLILLLFALANTEGLGQTDQIKIDLENGASLLLEKKPFDIKNQKVDYAEGKIVIAINDQPVFGIDGGLPGSVLTKAILTIDDVSFTLQTDKMFNPWFGTPGKPFKLTKEEGNRYMLNGLFSDGAGTYAAQWLILGRSSTRTILSSDESIIAALFEK